jgi:hypothetical protein
MRIVLAIVLSLAAVSPAFAQSEAQLRQYFEGMTVLVKIDMPATSDGVEVRPVAAMPVNFRDLANNIKQYGIGVHQGDRVMVTKVLVKGDHIEVQLGGGGFGTIGDRLRTMPAAPLPIYQSKTREEKHLEDQLKWASGSERRRIHDRLDEIRRDQRRDTALNAVVNAQVRQQQEANVRAQAAQSGSRFNIRYRDGFPADATSPDSIMQTLAKYVEFPDAAVTDGGGARPTSTASAAGAGSAIRKGMTVAQVEQLLGPAENVGRQSDGGLEVAAREYSTDSGQRISTKFVAGVLVDFTITPR